MSNKTYDPYHLAADADGCVTTVYNDVIPPNCPLSTGMRPCQCPNLPRCPECGYTKHDAAFEGDHDKCDGVIPGQSNRAYKYECAQHVVIYWNEERLLVFTFNNQDICTANTANEMYTGREKTYCTMAMSSIFHYPSIWTIRPES